jgi:ABC-2 type transport system ATP-binding protein
MSGTHIITLSGISKKFGDVNALEEISLDINEGISGIIGPNGAGKTTLLKIMLGLVKPDTGNGQILGYDMLHETLKIRWHIGVLHERPSYPVRMRVETYLERVERLYKKEGNTRGVLEMVNLFEARKRKIGALSAGMLQRLGIAQSLVGDPELVFLDEPTSNLDIDGRDSVARMIIDIHNQMGISFVVSSHILSELERVCHDIAVLQEGKLIASGRLQELVRKYTAKRYKIIVSDPQKLIDSVKPLKGIRNAEITGANMITVRIDSGDISTIEHKVRTAASGLNIDIYEIRQAETLEDAFREVVLSE